MASRVRFATIGFGVMLCTAVVWSGCNNDARKVKEGEAGQLRDLRSTLNLEIQSATIPETGNPTITFRATDQDGKPIDDFVDQAWKAASATATAPATAPYISSPRFVISELQQPAGDYFDIYQRVVTGRPYQPTEGGEIIQPATPPAGGFTQAVSSNPPTTDEATFRNFFQAKGDGVYTVTLGAPSRPDFDPADAATRGHTFTAAMWATQTVPGAAADETRASPAHATFNFVPAGGAADKYEVVTDQACNACHGELSAHDERTGTQLCITCHSPQSTDPETGNTVNFKVMIHKIHRGAGLPSVKTGTPYQIVGYSATRTGDQPFPPPSVHDFSDVNWPQPIQNCTTCHQGQNAAFYKEKPSQLACGACHDNVVFDPNAVSGLPACNVAEPNVKCAHIGLPTLDITQCSGCHTPDVIDGQHVVAGFNEAKAYRYEILKVEVPADRKPVITFRVTNPDNGQAYNLATNPTWTQTASGASRLYVDIGFPSTDYQNSVANFGQPIQIPIVDRPSVNPPTGLNTTLEDAGNGAYRVTSPVALPDGVTSGTVIMEGHPAVAAPAPTAGTRIPVKGAVEFFGVGGPAQPRREVVAVERCDRCHNRLSAHGSNRNESVQLCAVCHNPNATDKGRRTDATPGETPIDFKWMIHAIHSGEVREQDFTIYGFGGTPHQFPLQVPFNAGDCNFCHVNESYRLPLQQIVQGTTTSTGADPKAITDNVRDPPTVSVCMSCHEGRTNDQVGPARAHAETYAQNGVETCQNCHGPGGLADLAAVHPIRARDDNGVVVNQ